MLITRGEPSSEEAAIGAQAVNRSSVASLAFLTWDIIITMDQEIDLIWSHRWTYTTILYFFVRYIPMMVQFSLLCVGTELSPGLHFTQHDCYIWQVYQGVASMMVITSVDYILLLRIEALYHGRRVVKIVIRILYAAEVICMGIGLALATPSIMHDDICAVIGVPQELLIFGVATAVFQTCLFMLTAVRFIAAVRDGWGNIPVAELLLRDGIWAFFLIMAFSLGDDGLYLARNHAFANLFFSWLLTVFSFIGYRITLNLRREMITPAHIARTHAVSNIKFGSARPTTTYGTSSSEGDVVLDIR